MALSRYPARMVRDQTEGYGFSHHGDPLGHGLDVVTVGCEAVFRFRQELAIFPLEDVRLAVT